MHPPGSDEPFQSARLARFVNVDKEYYVMKMNNPKPVNEPAAKSKKSKAVRKVIKRVFLNNRVSRN